MANGQLPAGFVLDAPTQVPQQGLPAGFVLDQPAEPTLGQQIAGGFESAGQIVAGLPEAAASIATGAVTEPIAGIAGLVSAPFVGADRAADIIRNIQQAGTFQPRTEAGQATLGAIGGVVESAVGLIPEDIRQIPETAFEATGSPALAAALATLPTALAEAVGLGGLRKVRGAKKVTGITDETVDTLQAQGLTVDDLSAENIAALQRESLDKIQEADAARRGQQEPAPVEAPKPSAEEARQALVTEIDKGDLGKIAAEANLDPAIQAAARDLGVVIIPSAASRNLIFREIEQGLKSVPGSQLNAKEAAGVAQLASKADDLITEFGGTTNKAGLEIRFEKSLNDVIEGLNDKSDAIYVEKLPNLVPPKTPAQGTATLAFINGRSGDFGGKQELTALERNLILRLADKSKPTYARIDELRKRVGAAKRGQGDEIFKSADKGLLTKLESLLLDDQRASISAIPGAKEAGTVALFDTARKLVAQRKTLEGDMQELFGKKLQKSFLPQVGAALQQLGKGKFKAFEQLIDRVPNRFKQEVILSALNDVFVMGSRKEKQLSIPGFVDWYNGLKRNPDAFGALTQHLPVRAVGRLNRIATLAQGIRRAQESAITTGRIVAVPELFDKLESKMGKIFGVAAKAAVAEVPGAAIGFPGVASASIITRAMTKGKTPRSLSADQLLSSKDFRKVVQDAAVKGEEGAQPAAKKLERTATFKKWQKTLKPEEKKALAALGFISWLNSPVSGEQTEQIDTAR